MNRGAGRLRVKMRVAFDAAGLGREIFVAYYIAEPSRIIPATKVMKPRRIIDAVPQLEKEVKILGAQIQLVIGTPKVEAAVPGTCMVYDPTEGSFIEPDQRMPLAVSDPIVVSTKSVVHRILLADDSQIVRTTLKKFLVEKSPEWEISEAENGQAALEKVVALRPALVMLDLNLPDMSGQEAARQIRQLSAGTKIIICSFNEPAHLEVIAKQVGADGYVTKTSSSDDFHKTIAAVLSQPLTESNGNSSVQ